MSYEPVLALVLSTHSTGFALVALTFTAVIAIPAGSLFGLLREKLAAKISRKQLIASPQPHQKTRYENTFTNNWITDLFEAVATELEPASKLMQACGRGCFNRHKFKQNIANESKGDLASSAKGICSISATPGAATAQPRATGRPAPTTCTASARVTPKRRFYKPPSAGLFRWRCWNPSGPAAPSAI